MVRMTSSRPQTPMIHRISFFLPFFHISPCRSLSHYKRTTSLLPWSQASRLRTRSERRCCPTFLSSATRSSSSPRAQQAVVWLVIPAVSIICERCARISWPDSGDDPQVRTTRSLKLQSCSDSSRVTKRPVRKMQDAMSTPSLTRLVIGMFFFPCSFPNDALLF
jgi:hypothetical protein